MSFLETLASIDDEIVRPAAGAGLDDHQLAFIERHLYSLGDFSSGKLREISVQFHRALVHHQICNTRRSAEEIPLAYANVSETWAELRPKLKEFDAQTQR